ncbi:MAG: AbrB/MazE/SpoVT family DNA-binding domain-containing protein [Clostridia bacterium]|nr:AbrB/MazE/SpoVT family DNA-binding domain-containing protein [Clostridia bacterium]
MTQIGIVRKVDSLGRVTLPKELRRVFKLNENDKVSE